MYKTVIVNYSPVAKEMAANIENIANQMEQEGFVLVSCAVMPSAKGILIFRQTKSPQSDYVSVAGGCVQ